MIETESGHDMWSNQLGPSAIKALRGDTFTGHAVAITETGKTGVWTLAAGKRLGVVEHDGHPVVWNEIEPKASRLWTMTDDRRLWTWSLAGAPLGGFELNGAPSPDAKSGEPKIEIEKAYAGTGRSSLLFAYDIEDNKRQWWLWNEKTRALHQLPGPWLGNGGLSSLPSLSSSSSPAEAGWTFLQGNRLIERDPAGAVRVRTADTGEQLATLLPGKDKRDGRSADGTGTGDTKETPLPTVVSSADGSRIITNSVGRLQLWDAATGKPVPFEGGANVSRFEFQGKTLVIERTGGAIELRRAREGTTLSAMPGSDAEGAAGRASDTAGIDHFLAGNRLALGNNGEIWDLREGKRLLDHVLAADAAGEKGLMGELFR